MNKSIVIMIAFLSISIASAQSDILVTKLNYDKGNITLLNSTIKHGFAPDRRFQPEYGYTAEVIADSQVIDSFRFNIPNEIYIDASVNSTLTGGKIFLDEVNFSLVFDYQKDLDSIDIYSEKQEKVGSLKMEKGTNNYLAYVIAISVLLAILTLIFLRRKQ